MTLLLSGKHIVNTRAPHQSAELDALIRARGGNPLPYPCIDIAPPDDAPALESAVTRLAAGEFDWLVLTSANTVYALAGKLSVRSGNLPFRIAAIGPSTAQAAQTALNRTVDLLPDEHTSEGLAAALIRVSARRVLLPQSAIAPPTLADCLREPGVTVETVTAYQTVVGRGGVDLSELVRENAVDAVMFASPSAVRNFSTRRLEEGGHSLPEDIIIACIGPKTANAACTAGYRRVIAPAKYTLSAMLDSLSDTFKRE